MDENILTWLRKNVSGYEVSKTAGGRDIIYIPVFNKNNVQEGKAIKYFRRKNAKIKYAASFTWLSIYL